MNYLLLWNKETLFYLLLLLFDLLGMLQPGLLIFKINLFRLLRRISKTKFNQYGKLECYIHT